MERLQFCRSVVVEHVSGSSRVQWAPRPHLPGALPCSSARPARATAALRHVVLAADSARPHGVKQTENKQQSPSASAHHHSTPTQLRGGARESASGSDRVTGRAGLVDTSELASDAVGSERQSKGGTSKGRGTPTDGDEIRRKSSRAERARSKARARALRKEKEWLKYKRSEISGVVLTHAVADFDSLAAAVGLARLRDHQLATPGATCVTLPRGATPPVVRYLALHKNFFPIKSRNRVDIDLVDWLSVVDAQRRDRFGPCAEWLDKVEHVQVYDHHVDQTCDIRGEVIIEEVGSATTAIVERLMRAQVPLSEHEATLLALGIHTDTGSLVYECTTGRDARALAFCIEQGASQKAIMQFVHPVLSEAQRTVLQRALRISQVRVHNGAAVTKVHIEVDEYMPGMSYVAKDMLDLSSSHVLLMAISYVHKSGYRHVSIIGRATSDAQMDPINLNTILAPLNGGGHPKAAAVTLRMDRLHLFEDPQIQAVSDVDGLLELLVHRICMDQVPPLKRVADVMTPISASCICPVELSVDEAHALLSEHQHTALPVVAEGSDNKLLGVVSRGDLEKVQAAGNGKDSVKCCMRTQVYLGTPYTTLADVEHILVDKGVGCVPVVKFTCAMRDLVPDGAVVEMLKDFRSDQDAPTPTDAVSGRTAPHMPDQLSNQIPSPASPQISILDQGASTHKNKKKKQKHKKSEEAKAPRQQFAHYTLVGLITRSHVLKEHSFYEKV